MADNQTDKRKTTDDASPHIGKRLEAVVSNLADVDRRLEVVDAHLQRARAAERAAGARA